MNIELYTAKLMGVSRAAASQWRRNGLSKHAIRCIADHARLTRHEGLYMVEMGNEAFEVTPLLWGDLKGRQELKQSLNQLP
jgi:hypothetical protein